MQYLDREKELGEPIGKTTTTEREPNTTGKFHFWVKPGVIINPFDFVVVEHVENTLTVGMVEEIRAISDSQSHLTSYVSSEFGDPTQEEPVERLSSLVCEATVFRNTGIKVGDHIVEIKMPLGHGRRVFYANVDMIEKAIGMDLIMPENRIPAGIILQSNGLSLPVYFDSRYLLGLEGAHINVSGISGLATKTSYLMFLIKSIYDKMGDDVAVLIFNVKQSDLLRIHELTDDLGEHDLEYYEKLGISAEPFPEDKVRYFLPRGEGGEPNSEDPPDNYEIYAYELADVHNRLDLLFSEVPDPYQTLDAFVVGVRENWDQTNNYLVLNVRNRRITVRTWSDLKNLDTQTMQDAFQYSSPSTPPRIIRELRRLTSNKIFVDNRENEVYLGAEIKNIKGGDIFVVDIFRIPQRNQPFIVGDLMRSIDEMYAEKEPEELPKKLIIFIDELNTFAPSGSQKAITEQIIEIARKGRSRGVVLFGSEQFKSDVHEQVIGNCSVHVVGRTCSSELRKPAYGFLPENIKENALVLGKGEMIISFPTWRSPVKVFFPKPPYKRLERRRT